MRKYFLNALCVILLLISSPCWGVVDFDDADDILTLSGTENDFDPTTSVSVSFWYKGTYTGDTIWVSKRDSDDASYWQFSPKGDDSNYIIFYDGSEACQTTAAVISDETWHHIGLTFDWSASGCGNEFKVYVDGASKATTSWFGSETSAPSNATNLQIGGLYDLTNSDGNEVVEGEMSSVAVWIDQVITQAEFQMIYNSKNMLMPLQIQKSKLKGFWTLGDEEDGSSADGDTFIDYSGNGNNMVGNNGVNNTGLTARAEVILTYP